MLFLLPSGRSMLGSSLPWFGYRMSAKKTGNIVEFLEDSLADVEKMRYEVCKKDDTPLQNIIDEIVGLYLSTLYKLKFLA